MYVYPNGRDMAKVKIPGCSQHANFLIITNFKKMALDIQRATRKAWDNNTPVGHGPKALNDDMDFKLKTHLSGTSSHFLFINSKRSRLCPIQKVLFFYTFKHNHHIYNMPHGVTNYVPTFETMGMGFFFLGHFLVKGMSRFHDHPNAITYYIRNEGIEYDVHLVARYLKGL